MRTVVFYKNHFADFFETLTDRAKERLEYLLFVLETQPYIPTKYVKHISGSSGIYEIRATVGSNEYRVLFFFESGSLVEGGTVVILGNGFLKKSEKDYRRAVEKAEQIRIEYFEELENQ